MKDFLKPSQEEVKRAPLITKINYPIDMNNINKNIE
jgi:hypothetical protein